MNPTPWDLSSVYEMLQSYIMSMYTTQDEKELERMRDSGKWCLDYIHDRRLKEIRKSIPPLPPMT